MRTYLFALALLSIPLAATAAPEQQPVQQRSGTPEEQKACTRDVERFCRQVMDQGDFTVLACLKDNRPKISSACNLVLKNHGQ